MAFSLAHYLYMCVLCVNTCCLVRVYIHIVLRICSGSSHASSVIPRVTVCQEVFFLSTITTIKVP